MRFFRAEAQGSRECSYASARASERASALANVRECACASLSYGKNKIESKECPYNDERQV